jgi:hypothetical protein
MRREVDAQNAAIELIAIHNRSIVLDEIGTNNVIELWWMPRESLACWVLLICSKHFFFVDSGVKFKPKKAKSWHLPTHTVISERPLDEIILPWLSTMMKAGMPLTLNFLDNVVFLSRSLGRESNCLRWKKKEKKKTEIVSKQFCGAFDLRKREIEPRHLLGIRLEWRLIAVWRDEYNLEFKSLGLHVIVRLGQNGCESSARRAPVGREVDPHSINPREGRDCINWLEIVFAESGTKERLKGGHFFVCLFVEDLGFNKNLGLVILENFSCVSQFLQCSKYPNVQNWKYQFPMS